LPAPLIVTEAQLTAHFRAIGQILAAVADVSVKLQMDVNWTLSPVVGGLIGEGCESIFRNRGIRVPVAPLLHLQRGLWAWLGYREEWDPERPSGNVRRFSFRSAGLTIHFGWKNDLFKPQIFRVEWAGWARWGGYEYGFQAADAGHPHWQFDALDSLTSSDIAERAAMLRELLENEGGDEQKDFSPQLIETDARDIITDQKLSRIHFASAAAWWKAPPHNDHAHSPTSTTDIRSWVERSVGYLKNELGRLQA
jgi:hypothetical protein